MATRASSARASSPPVACSTTSSKARTSRHYVEERLLTTTLDKAANWARGNAFMPATFGLACCAIEMMAAVNARMDIARFGFEAFRA